MTLKNAFLLAVLAGSAGLTHAQTTQAQANPAAAATSRQQVKMETKEFLATHTWDPYTDTWSLKSGYEPPTGVMSRADVKAKRDAFMSSNRWNTETGSYVAIPGGPRQMNSLTREQVKKETVQFMKTHRWDESSEAWVDTAQARMKK